MKISNSNEDFAALGRKLDKIIELLSVRNESAATSVIEKKGPKKAKKTEVVE